MSSVSRAKRHTGACARTNIAAGPTRDWLGGVLPEDVHVLYMYGAVRNLHVRPSQNVV
jgi:hypothetical protein